MKKQSKYEYYEQQHILRIRNEQIGPNYYLYCLHFVRELVQLNNDFFLST